MEEIPNPINNGINYQPQLVSRISAINSIILVDFWISWGGSDSTSHGNQHYQVADRRDKQEICFTHGITRWQETRHFAIRESCLEKKSENWLVTFFHRLSQGICPNQKNNPPGSSWNNRAHQSLPKSYPIWGYPRSVRRPLRVSSRRWCFVGSFEAAIPRCSGNLATRACGWGRSSSCSSTGNILTHRA